MSDWRRSGKEKLLKDKVNACFISTKDLPLSPSERLKKFKECLTKEEVTPAVQAALDECKREEPRVPKDEWTEYENWCVARFLARSRQDTPLNISVATEVTPPKSVSASPAESVPIGEPSSSYSSFSEDVSLLQMPSTPTRAIKIGPIRVSVALLDLMRRYIENREYRHYSARRVDQTTSAGVSFDLELPIEQGFLLLLDANNNLIPSDRIKGEAIYLDTLDVVRQLAGRHRIVGVFHTHPHPTHSLIPGAGDYLAAKDFDSIIGYSVDFLAIGGFYGKDPVVHLLLKKTDCTWDQFLASPVLILHDALFPEPLEEFQLQISPSEIDRLWVYDTESRIAIDLAKKIVLSRYFEIVTVNLNSYEVIENDYAVPEVLDRVIRVMRAQLNRFPADLCRKMERAITKLYPTDSSAFITFYRNTFLHFLEKSYQLRFKQSLLGHLRRSLRFRYLRVKDFFEEFEVLDQHSPSPAIPDSFEVSISSKPNNDLLLDMNGGEGVEGWDESTDILAILRFFTDDGRTPRSVGIANNLLDEDTPEGWVRSDAIDTLFAMATFKGMSTNIHAHIDNRSLLKRLLAKYHAVRRVIPAKEWHSARLSKALRLLKGLSLITPNPNHLNEYSFTSLGLQVYDELSTRGVDPWNIDWRERTRLLRRNVSLPPRAAPPAPPPPEPSPPIKASPKYIPPPQAQIKPKPAPRRIEPPPAPAPLPSPPSQEKIKKTPPRVELPPAPAPPPPPVPDEIWSKILFVRNAKLVRLKNDNYRLILIYENGAQEPSIEITEEQKCKINDDLLLHRFTEQRLRQHLRVATMKKPDLELIYTAITEMAKEGQVFHAPQGSGQVESSGIFVTEDNITDPTRKGQREGLLGE